MVEFTGVGTPSVESLPMTNFIALVRRKIKDTGTVFTDDFIGDGVTYNYRLAAYPVKQNTEGVFVSGIKLPTSGYVFDEANGLLYLSGVPANGAPIRLIYTAYERSDSEMEDFVVGSIQSMNVYLGTNYTELQISSFEESERYLCSLICMRDIFMADMLSSADSKFLLRDNDKTIDKSRIPANQKDLVKFFDEKIIAQVREMNLNGITGHARSGGAIPIDFDGVGWWRINGTP